MSNRAEELAHSLAIVQNEIASYQPELIVVTKTYPVSDVEILFNLGVRNFGENRNEEGAEKSTHVNARWHYQGEVQGKKLRSISLWADVIHSLDSLEHLSKLNRLLEESGGRTKLAKLPSHSSMSTASVLADTTGDMATLLTAMETDGV